MSYSASYYLCRNYSNLVKGDDYSQIKTIAERDAAYELLRKHGIDPNNPEA